MNNNTILAIVFLMAGTLLTTAVTMVPTAYADNKQKAEEGSAASLTDCDDNEVDENSDFDCFGIAVNDIGVSLGDAMTAATEPLTTLEEEE